jgi:hypothetical protein
MVEFLITRLLDKKKIVQGLLPMKREFYVPVELNLWDHRMAFISIKSHILCINTIYSKIFFY